MRHLNFKTIFAWVIGTSFIFLVAYLFKMVFVVGINDEFIELYKAHFPALVGLPSAAFFSTFLILLLPIIRKQPIEFEAIGLKFKGTSGEVVLWVLIFLSIVVSIKLIW